MRSNKPSLSHIEKYLTKHIAINKDTSCWIYTGYIEDNGYGRTPWGEWAHRASWEIFRGQLLADREIAHVECKNKACINPEHLDQLTKHEHMRLDGNWNRDKTHCIRGHPFNKENTRYNNMGGRQCIACHNRWLALHRSIEPLSIKDL